MGRQPPARGGRALSRVLHCLFSSPFVETEDLERQLRTRSVATVVLLAGIGAASLMRPWREPQGSAYWEAKPLGALGWLLTVVIVSGLATVASGRIPSRQEGLSRRVALAVLFLTFVFLGLAVSPLI